MYISPSQLCLGLFIAQCLSSQFSDCHATPKGAERTSRKYDSLSFNRHTDSYRILSRMLIPNRDHGANGCCCPKTTYLSTIAKDTSQQPCTIAIEAGAYLEARSTIFEAAKDRSNRTASKRSSSTRQDQRNIRRQAKSCDQDLEARVQDRQ